MGIQQRHRHAVLICLLSTLSLTGAVASQPAKLPCAAWQNSNNTVCLRSQNLSIQPQTAADKAMTASTTSNLAVDQALVALTNDVTVLPKAAATAVALKVDLRHSEPVPIKTKVKHQPAVPTKMAYKAPPVKAQLSRSQIVRNELNREKADLRTAVSRLQSARKSGQSAGSLERQVADRRASISAMQSELARL